MLSSLVFHSLQFLDFNEFKIPLLVLSAILIDSLLQRHPYFNDYTGFQYLKESITRLRCLLLKLCILANHLIYLTCSFHIAPAALSDHHHQTFSSSLTSVRPLAGAHLHTMPHHYGIHCLRVYVTLLNSLPSVKISKHISFLLNICFIVCDPFLPLFSSRLISM